MAVAHKVVTGLEIDSIYNQTLKDEWHQKRCDKLIADYGLYACSVVISLMEKGGTYYIFLYYIESQSISI